MKILMVAMSMDIGGAETHIVELSTALVSKGHDVTVASAGGVYDKVLCERGIHHVTLPLNRRSLFPMIRSYVGLRKLIRKEVFDIVHAHARIPAFLCGLLQRNLHFRFVTTAHGAFSVSPILKRLTDWGECTFAVSEDIRRYLIENYEVNPAHIYRTVNGIDTKAFSPKSNGGFYRIKLGIPDGQVILHVSRLDKASSLCAAALMDAVPLLPSDVMLLIVGGGNYENTLREKAYAINESLGREAILLVGAKTDISDYIAASDIFVGPSRAAMEALSCGKPAVISGSEGHGGIFDEQLTSAAEASNFCFRQHGLPTAERLAKEISHLLSMDKKARDRLGAFGRAFITERYSVEKMTEPHIEVYNAMLSCKTQGKPDIVICGYYGYGNAGDESMLASLVNGIRRIAPELCLCVMSAHPKKTKRRYLVDSVWRFHLPVLRKKFTESRLFLFGGGNLLQDRTSRRSLVYYTEVLKLAKTCGANIMIYANGIGPIDDLRNLSRVKKALSLADSISLRDKASFSLCKKLVPRKNIRLTFDPAVTGKRSQNSVADGNYFVIIPKKNTREVFEKTATLIDHIRKAKGLSPRIICFYNSEDLAYCRKLAAKTDAPLFFGLSDEEIIDCLSHASLVISARLHGLVYATAACAPMMSFSDDCKLSSYLDYIGFGEDSLTPSVAIPLEDLEQLSEMADRLIEDKEKIRGALSTKLPTLCVMAEYEFQEAVRAARGDKNS